MLVAQAHSFAQQARLAITLAWIAGYTNIVTILACGTVTSHVSGTTSNLGRDIAEGAWGLAGFAALLLAAFYVGAAIAGTTTEVGRRRAWESIYVLPIAIEAFLLLMFAIGLEMNTRKAGGWATDIQFLAGLASMAMGLQNATITSISNGVIRTTHVTGVLTDLGLESAQFTFWAWDRRSGTGPRSKRSIIRSVTHHPTSRRLALLLAIVGSFALGAGLGTLIQQHFPHWSMIPPVLFLGWIIAMDILRPIAEIEASDLMAAGDDFELPANLAIYHVHKDRRRRGKFHQMPNLIAWAGRLPRDVRVVILDLGHEARLDRNAAMDLRAVLALMRSQGRRLILAGLDEAEFAQLRDAADGALEASDVCPDMDMAFLHAMTIATAPVKHAARGG